MNVISIFLFLIFSGTLFAGDHSYLDERQVKDYVHNSEMQRRWAMSFLAPSLKKLKGDEHILDIGCGDGRITADISRFVPEGTVIGIDPSEACIEWAKKQYAYAEYSNLSFVVGGFAQPRVEGQFDVIISNCALQHCSEHEQAVENFVKLLKPGGKLLIMVPAINNDFWKEATKAVRTSPKWGGYWKSWEPRKFSIPDDKRFIVVRKEVVQTVDPFIDREEFFHFLFGTFSHVAPEELVKEMFHDMIDEYLERCPDALKEDGTIELRYGRFEYESYLSRYN